MRSERFLGISKTHRNAHCNLRSERAATLTENACFAVRLENVQKCASRLHCHFRCIRICALQNIRPVCITIWSQLHLSECKTTRKKMHDLPCISKKQVATYITTCIIVCLHLHLSECTATRKKTHALPCVTKMHGICVFSNACQPIKKCTSCYAFLKGAAMCVTRALPFRLHSHLHVFDRTAIHKKMHTLSCISKMCSNVHHACAVT